MSSNSAEDDPAVVWLNVYDMSPHNKYTYPLGLGVFHSGVEVYGTEFVFGGHELEVSGIFQMTPKVGVPGIKLRSSIRLGRTKKTQREVYDQVQRMSLTFTGRSYNIINRHLWVV